MKPSPNSSISIWGVGGIGLAAVAGAVITQCHPIVAIDISPENLQLAKSFGATHTFLINEINEDVIKSITKDEGFDFAVEASGQVGSIEKAFYSVRDRGGLCIFASHPPEHDLISLEPHALIRGKNKYRDLGEVPVILIRIYPNSLIFFIKESYLFKI